jgi:Cytochrome b5-like Heme/Steroid binding domain
MYVSVSMWAHRISGFLIFVSVFTMAMITFKQDKWELKSGLHPALGLSVVVCMSLLTIGGITTRLLLEKSRWNTGIALRIKMGHKLFGYLILFVTQVTLVTGGLAYADRGYSLAKSLVIAEIVVFSFLVLIFEIFFQIYKRKEQPFKEVGEIISRDDFDARVAEGEHLVLLDDLVLDVSKFKSEHPGGQFVLDFHIGRDVSKFFYGGYVLENSSGLAPHTHSNVARAIVNGMIIGKLTTASETFEGRIVSTHDINKNTKVFTFQIEGQHVNYRAPASTST